MYLRNAGPIREYLTPGVEVVSVDPNCVYGVDDDDELMTTDSDEDSETSGDDLIVDVEGDYDGRRRLRKAHQLLQEGGSSRATVTHMDAYQMNVFPTATTPTTAPPCLGKPLSHVQPTQPHLDSNHTAYNGIASHSPCGCSVMFP